MSVDRRTVLAAVPLVIMGAGNAVAFATGTHPIDQLKSHFSRKGRVELLDSGNDTDGSPYAVIATSDNDGWDWNITLFKTTTGQWTPHCSIASPAQRSNIPIARYFPNSHQVLMVSAVGYGTGVFYQRESWFRLRTGEPKLITTYPRSFHYSEGGVSREARMHPVTLPRDLAHACTIQLDFEAACHRSDCSPSYSHAKRRVMLRWNENSGQFEELGPGYLREINEWFSQGFV